MDKYPGSRSQPHTGRSCAGATGRPSKRLRKLIARYGDRCVWGCDRKPCTVEHVVPRAKGGTNAVVNLKPACCICNNARGDSTLPPTDQELSFALFRSEYVYRLARLSKSVRAQDPLAIESALKEMIALCPEFTVAAGLQKRHTRISRSNLRATEFERQAESQRLKAKTSGRIRRLRLIEVKAVRRRASRLGVTVALLAVHYQVSKRTIVACMLGDTYKGVPLGASVEVLSILHPEVKRRARKVS